MTWNERFRAAWPQHTGHYPATFKRMGNTLFCAAPGHSSPGHAIAADRHGQAGRRPTALADGLIRDGGDRHPGRLEANPQNRRDGFAGLARFG